MLIKHLPITKQKASIQPISNSKNSLFLIALETFNPNKKKITKKADRKKARQMQKQKILVTKAWQMLEICPDKTR